MKRENLRVTVTLNRIEDSLVCADLDNYKGADKVRRARLLMRLGLMAVNPVLNGATTANSDHSKRTDHPQTKNSRTHMPEAFDAFDSLGLDVFSLQENLAFSSTES